MVTTTGITILVSPSFVMNWDIQMEASTTENEKVITMVSKLENALKVTLGLHALVVVMVWFWVETARDLRRIAAIKETTSSLKSIVLVNTMKQKLESVLVKVIHELINRSFVNFVNNNLHYVSN